MSFTLDVYKRWGTFTLDVKLSQGGGILGLLGASGCGKSKTLQCLAGIERPERGRVVVNGRVLFDAEKKIDVKVQQRRVGYLFQHYALFPNMTVAENIACGLRQKDKSAEKIAAMLRRFHLTGLENQKPAELSGGQQQRTALARILLNEPEILLLDEPFSALDSYLKEKVITEVKTMLTAFPRDVILVTHSRDEAYQLCDDLAILDHGRVSRYGPAKAVFADPQSRVAAILTGCKNIIAAKKAGPQEVYIPAWQLTLHTNRPVADNLTAIGIRAHAFRPQEEANRQAVQITEIVEQPFEWIVKFRYPGQQEGAADIWWRFAKPARPSDFAPALGVSGKDILLLYR